MAGLTAEAAVKRYTEAAQQGTTKSKYKEGIDAVIDNPMQKAADKDDLFLRRVQESVSTGKRRQKLLAVPMQRWKDNAKGKGADRLASGMVAAADKVRAHFQVWTPRYNEISQTVQAMPKGTREDAKARAAKAIDMSMDFAGRQ